MIRLQAHRGVSTEYPENTMSAFDGAVEQGYEIIELDPNVTLDGKFVVLHDDTLNRTARNYDGSRLDQTKRITEIPYSEASKYDFGIWFSKKYSGEKLPLLEDVLKKSKESGIMIKIDNKFRHFTEKNINSFFELLKRADAKLAMTCNSIDLARKIADKLPRAEIHYDGAINEGILNELNRITDNLTVWLPYRSELTSWVNVSFASRENCRLVKKYAKLGIWIISKYEDFDYVCENYSADIVETTGAIKPVRNRGLKTDMHTHSEYSHDSICPISEMARAEIENGAGVFAVTDHCDVLFYETTDVVDGIKRSVNAAQTAGMQFKNEIKVLSGVEIGEGAWYPQITEQVMGIGNFDIVIGSVHAVKYKKYSIPYSQIDFSQMSINDIYGFMDKYFDDVMNMLENVPCDVMAHLTCPLRYITGKYKKDVDLSRYMCKIKSILRYIIDHAIALEINTSGLGSEYGRFMPEEWIIKLFKEMGGYLITIGSDAHISENAANGFDAAFDLLKKYDFRNYYYFEKRKIIQCTVK